MPASGRADHSDRHRPAPRSHRKRNQGHPGGEIAARYRVINHDAKALEQHRWLGKTRRGIPVYIDERFMARIFTSLWALSSST